MAKNLEEDNIDVRKPGFDSRIPFTQLLVKHRAIVIYSAYDGFWAWADSLRHYYSNTRGMIVEQARAKQWIDKFNVLMKNAICAEQCGKTVWERTLSSNLKPRLFSLQDEIFDITAHLYLPMGETDEEDFDPKMVLGRDGNG